MNDTRARPGRRVPGACVLPGAEVRFSVWAPSAEAVLLRIVAPDQRTIPLPPAGGGWWEVVVPELGPGARYRYVLDGRALADPASRSQPEGVHGPSEVVDPRAFVFANGFENPPIEGYVISEIHVGTFTEAGTLDAAIQHLDELRALGITAVELMPVAQFPGERNWGYDGVFPFAAQDSYGGPAALARFVDAAHARDLAVILDVVYNHFGPEGAVFDAYGPYLTDRYPGPWGASLNFDGPGSDEVRQFFIENALWWTQDLRIDALRLDAVHAIVDSSAIPFLTELASEVHAAAARAGRRVHLIAESDSNDARLTAPPERGGIGMDAQWSDDLHHSLHALLTGESTGYYADYGMLGHLARALAEGFVYQGEYSAYRGRRHGSPAVSIPAAAHVVCAQNHDQIGNRMLGDRLSATVDAESLKLAAGIVLLSAHVPLLFMGEEYAETAPFPYFVSHSDPALIEAVRRGRAEEFAAFDWRGEPPDAQDEKTFLRAKLDRSARHEGIHAAMLALTTELLRARRETPSLATLDAALLTVECEEERGVLRQQRRTADDADETVVVACFADAERVVTLPPGAWDVEIDSASVRWGGPRAHPASPSAADPAEVTVAPRSFMLLRRRI